MKILIKDGKRGNMATEFKRKNTISEGRQVDETKSFRLYPVQECSVSGSQPHVRCILNTRADKPRI